MGTNLAHQSEVKIRIGIIGCGTITKVKHLPIALSHPDITVTALVDNDLERVELLKHAFGLSCRVSNDYRTVLRDVDAVIVAVPNYLHVPVTTELLRAGVHVFCEKPLAIDADGARECCAAAEESGMLLTVGAPRRFYDSTVVMRMLLEEQALGTVTSYDWENGAPFDWQTATGFLFQKKLAGGGVLLDEGVHFLDPLQSWFGPATCLTYQDDNWGSGIEANSFLEMEHEGHYGKIRGSFRLSRTYELKNRLLVYGERATAEIRRNDIDKVYVHCDFHGKPMVAAYQLPALPTDAFYRQLDNFVKAIQGVEKLIVDGVAALQTIQLVESCYQHAARFPEPWLEVDAVAVEEARD
jgi:predicted dehydrogenase